MLDAPKLLGLHSWRWNKHGSKCALPGVRVCAWKCLFEQSLPIICTFIPSFTSDAFASSSSNSKRTLFQYLYADKSAQFDVFSSNIRFYTFIYDGKRLFERHANKKTYIRLYTFIYVLNRVIKYALYTHIYVFSKAGSTWKLSIAKFQPRKPLLHRAIMHGAQLELQISKQYQKSIHFRTLKIHKKTNASQSRSIFENVSTVEMHENCHD